MGMKAHEGWLSPPLALLYMAHQIIGLAAPTDWLPNTPVFGVMTTERRGQHFVERRTLHMERSSKRQIDSECLNRARL